MGHLHKVGIGLKEYGNETTSLFEEIIPDFFKVKYSKPSDYVNHIWKKYEESRKGSSLNGPFFELTLATLFIREGLVPLYIQAKVAFVPNVSYDLLLVTSDEVPIGISAKTSLRERYKQADLEAVALKNVHRRAKNYLLTLDAAEARRVKLKIEKGDVLGLDQVIVASETDLNELIASMKKNKYITSPTVSMVSGRVVDVK